MRTFLLACIAGIVFAGPAAAGTYFTVELAEPASDDTFVAQGSVWTCKDQTCVAELSRKSITVRVCKKIAKEAGLLTQASSEDESLSEEDLAECNEAAKR